MIKVGDKVSLISLGYAHNVSLKMENKEVDTFTVTIICSKSKLEGAHFYVEGGYYYLFDDIKQIFTQEKDPEYFL